MKTLNESRWSYFPKLFKDLGFTVGAEIGVELGAFSKTLIQDNPILKLYSVVVWDPYETWVWGKSRDRQNSYYERAKVNLAPYNCEIIKGASMDVVKQFEDESLDFVYIDAAHDYDHVKEDIREWSEKVRKGGIVAGHDYFVFQRSGNDGVVRAVDEWVKENNIDLIVLNDGKRAPSWLYEKH